METLKEMSPQNRKLLRDGITAVFLGRVGLGAGLATFLMIFFYENARFIFSSGVMDVSKGMMSFALFAIVLIFILCIVEAVLSYIELSEGPIFLGLPAMLPSPLFIFFYLASVAVYAAIREQEPSVALYLAIIALASWLALFVSAIKDTREKRYGLQSFMGID
jgi:hypothetical protein